MTAKNAGSVFIAAAALIISPLAHADSELELISGAATVTVTTGVPVVYNGSVGGWNINVSTGTLLGSSGLDLNSIDASASGTSVPLEILWSSSISSISGTTFTGAVGGTISGGITDTFSSYYGSSLLSTANPLTAPLTFSTLSFSGTDSGVSGGGTYLTEEAFITPSGVASEQTSFDFQVTGPPPPSTTIPDAGTTLGLLGCSMAALTAVRSRFGKRK